MIVTNDPTGIFLTNQEQIVKLAAKNRLPAIYPQSTYVNAGGLVSYAANELENYRRAATVCGQDIEGCETRRSARIEQPMKFEFIVNLKAAKQIGLTIPPNVLARADKVIR